MENQPDKQKASPSQGSKLSSNEPSQSNNHLSKEKRAKNRYDISQRFAIFSDLRRRSGIKERQLEQHNKEHFEILKHEKYQNYQEVSTGVKLSEVETRQIEWLWPNRIPFGKITILDGDPGIGKSLLAITIAACISTGRRLPDGTPGWQGGIILIAPEDSAEDTIKSRMEAAGCDPSQVLLLNSVLYFDEKKVDIYERPFSLSRDLKDLEIEIRRNNAVLVVIDPLMAVLGRNIDSSRDQDIREVFTPLAQLAERTGSAILIIRHLNKGNSANILYRGSGSIGIIASARMGLLVAQDPP
jgi:RecA-family ATPase